MTISSISSMASPANAYSSHMKRHGQSDTALHFGRRFGSFDSDDSSDSFGIPSRYWSPSAHDSDLEEKAAVPPAEEESKTDTDTASLNSQRTRKRDKVWSFLSGKRAPRPSLNPAPSMQLHDGGQRRWSMPDQPSAQETSKMKRVGNWLLKPFRSRGNSQPPTPSRPLYWPSQLEDRALESSLSMALSSTGRGFETETPPTSNNDRRTSL